MRRARRGTGEVSLSQGKLRRAPHCPVSTTLCLVLCTVQRSLELTHPAHTNTPPHGRDRQAAGGPRPRAAGGRGRARGCGAGPVRGAGDQRGRGGVAGLGGGGGAAAGGRGLGLLGLPGGGGGAALPGLWPASLQGEIIGGIIKQLLMCS